MAVEIFDLIARDIGMHYELYIVKDGKFGGLINGKRKCILYFDRDDKHSGLINCKSREILCILMRTASTENK